MNTVTIDPATYSNIVTQVGTFYNHAWSMLITWGAILVFFVGGVLPVVYQLLIQKQQERNFDIKQKESFAVLKEYINELMKGIEKSIDDKFDVKSKEINQETKKMNALSLGTSFHIQGNNNREKSRFKSAYTDYVAATGYYYDGDDYRNAAVTLFGLRRSIEKLKYTELLELGEIRGTSLSDLLKRLEGTESKGTFQDEIEEIRKIIIGLRDASLPKPT